MAEQGSIILFLSLAPILRYISTYFRLSSFCPCPADLKGVWCNWSIYHDLIGVINLAQN